MSHNSISVAEALERLNKGENVKGASIDFAGSKVKALDAFKLGKEGSLTIHIEINENVKEWIQKNGIEVNHLMEELLQNFYSTHQLIEGK